MNITSYIGNQSSNLKNATPQNMGNVTIVVASDFDSRIIIPLYIIIFLLSIIGNMMVLCTLFQNRRMRTVTNVYLVNLAVADLLLGVFCMPFTLVGQVLRNFIFGGVMCKLIPYFQAVSVSVAVWTLVAISLERYFAICRPLKSRRWQTQFHAYKMIFFVWIASLLWSSPVLAVSSLKAMKQIGTFKCREEWPSMTSERIFNLILDGVLLILPLLIMTLAYSLIVSKLWKRLQKEIRHNSFHKDTKTHIEMKNIKSNLQLTNSTQLTDNNFIKNTNKNVSSMKDWLKNIHHVCAQKSIKCTNCNVTMTSYVETNKSNVLFSSDDKSCEQQINENLTKSDGVDESATFQRLAIRSNYIGKSIEAKKKVIRMLFVIVLEFFICWAPIHILNTWYLFWPEVVYNMVGPTGISLVQLLAYISSCCNPITYCFMNRKFRQSFFTMFYSQRLCCFCNKVEVTHTKDVHVNNAKIKLNNSDGSANDSTIYPGRVSILGRSEVVVLEGEERV